MNNKTLSLIIFSFCSLMIFSFFLTTSQITSIEMSTEIYFDSITGNKPEIDFFVSQIKKAHPITQEEITYSFANDFLDWGVDDIDAEVVLEVMMVQQTLMVSIQVMVLKLQSLTVVLINNLVICIVNL